MHNYKQLYLHSLFIQTVFNTIFMNPFFKLEIILFFIHYQATAVYQAKEKLKSIEKARKGIIVLLKL